MFRTVGEIRPSVLNGSSDKMSTLSPLGLPTAERGSPEFVIFVSTRT